MTLLSDAQYAQFPNLGRELATHLNVRSLTTWEFDEQAWKNNRWAIQLKGHALFSLLLEAQDDQRYYIRAWLRDPLSHHLPHNEHAPHITIAIGKSVAQIANDITRRLLPETERVAKLAQARYDDWAQRCHDAKNLAFEIGRHTPRAYVRDADMHLPHHTLSAYYGDTTSLQFQVSDDAVEIKGRVSPAMALAIAQALEPFSRKEHDGE